MEKDVFKLRILSVLLSVALLVTMTACSGVGGGGGSDQLTLDYVDQGGAVQQADDEASQDNAEKEGTSFFSWLGKRLSKDKTEAGNDVQTEQQAVDGDTAAAQAEQNNQIDETAGKTAETQTKENKSAGNTAQKEAPKTQSNKNNDNKDENKIQVTMHIRCDTAVDKGMHLEDKWAGIVPASGIIMNTTTFSVDKGSTVFDVLCIARDKYKFHMQYSGSSDSVYIEGINNLYEFDGGRWSGWMYCVNGWYPNYGCGAYVLKGGESIEWNYTCDLGKDLEGAGWVGE